MFTIKKNDTRYAMKAILKSMSGLPVNLSKCTVKFIMAEKEREPFIHDAINGEVWVIFQPEDTDKIGYFNAEFKVTYEDGKVETFPNDDYIKIHVSSSLI